MIEFIKESSSGDRCMVKFIDLNALLKYVREHGTVILEAPDSPGAPYHMKTVD